ncbi:MAG: efflux RND transporter periplasmic adaptor subunit [Thermodesulfobacteriota bacterium]
MRKLTLLLLWIIFIGGCGSKESVSTEKFSKGSVEISEERQVEIIEVMPGPLSYTLSAVGSLKAPEKVTISPKKAGIIRKICVKEGDFVKKGQVLVELDDVDARLQVERAEANLKQIEASLETNRNTLRRYEKLFESKVIPQQTYDDIKLKVQLDEARLDLAKAELKLAKQNLQDHQIISSIDGVVNLKVASPGEHVNVAPKDEILIIVQMDPLDLEFYVPENWASKVRLGNKVQFLVKAFSEEKFSATVNFISPTADPSTRNVRMKAIVSNPQHRLKPGFFAEVTLPIGTRTDAILIPESALFSQEGKYYAFIVQDGVARRKEIETGIRFEGKVEILKGIQGGDRVITVGHEQLSDGMKVKITPKS